VLRFRCFFISANETGPFSYAHDARRWGVNGAATIYVADPASCEILDDDGGGKAILRLDAFGRR
jgi:hypothetical protein